MSDLSAALNLIRKYEGFNEQAFSDPYTGKDPYTIGYGTQFYPDGSPVKRGQRCSPQKALELLFHETNIIDTQLLKLNLGLDDGARQALVSFIHSIGWEPFLYSAIIDCIEQENYCGAVKEIGSWIFNPDHQVVGNLLDRRREEINLFLRDVDANPWSSTEVLLTAFRNYAGAFHQVQAIRRLEELISPYILAEFANRFCIDENPWADLSIEEADLATNS